MIDLRSDTKTKPSPEMRAAIAAAEAASDPRALKDAPHRRPVQRLDEVKAAKRAIVKYGFDEHPDLARDRRPLAAEAPKAV